MSSKDSLALMDMMDDYLFIFSYEGTILHVNRSAVKRLGYKKSDLVSKPVYVVHPPEFRNQARDELAEVVQGKAKILHIPLLTKSGLLIPVETRIKKGLWKGEKAIFVLSRDKTNPTEVERMIRLIIEHSDQNIWLVDRKYRIIEFNKKFATDFYMAYKIRLKIGLNIIAELRKILPPLADDWQARYDRALAGESFMMTDHFVVQGKDMYVDSHFYPIQSGDEITGVSVFTLDNTYGKTYELALKASEEKYKMAFNYAAFGMVLTKPDGNFMDVNPYFCDMVGYSHNQLLKLSIEKIIHPQDRIVYISRLTDLLSDKIPFLWLEIRFVHRRGFVQWGMISSTVLRDAEGNSKFIICHIQDITEKRKAEKELEKKTSQQEMILQTARHLTQTLELKQVLNKIAHGATDILDAPSVSIYFLSNDRQTLYPVIAIDPAYKKELLAAPLPVATSVTGRAITEKRGIIINHIDTKVLGKQIPGTPEEIDERLISTPFLMDNEIFGAMTIARIGREFTDNDLSLAETYATYAATALKNARIYEALQKEIEDRKQAEKRLSDLNLEYEKFIQNNLAGIWKVRLKEPIPTHFSLDNIFRRIMQDAVIDDCNDVAAGMYDMESRQSILNRPLKELNLASHDWPRVIRDFIRNGYKMEMVDIDEQIGDQLKHFRYSFFGNVEDGCLTWIWGIQLDITSQKHLEQQLLQSQKMESIGTLAGGIAHDFNNLLTVINGHAELAMMKTPPDSPIYKDIKLILEGGERAGNLTRQLLAFSRKQIVKPGVIDLNQLILNMDKMLRRLLSEEIAIETHFDPTIPKILADPGQMEQILMNLIINARDALNESGVKRGGKHIWITTHHKVLEKQTGIPNEQNVARDYVLLTVRDNGTGIKSSIKDKIFEPFFTTKSIGKGTGLGLATTYAIINQNQGFIDLDSEEGKGTTFTIYWPAITQNESEIIRQRGTKTILKGKETILFVEDDDSVREFAGSALRELGYKVIEYPNGQEALDYVQKSKKKEFDILVTDVVMPRMNGKDLVNKLTQIYPDTHILFTSGYVDDNIDSSEFTKDNRNFLQKPYSIKALAQRIREIIDLG